MENNLDTEQNSVKNRLLQFLEYKNLSQKRFEEICGLSNGYVNNIRKSIKLDTFNETIEPNFPELNRNWLLLGDGEMLIEEEDEGDELVTFLRVDRKNYDISLSDISEKTGIPQKTLKDFQWGDAELSEEQAEMLSQYVEGVREYYEENALGTPKGKPTGYYYPEVSASAGFDITNFNNEAIRIPIYLPEFGNDVIFINVYGDSMYPKYKSGDMIGVKPVEFLYLVFGHPYVVVFDNGDTNIKYVRKGSDDKHIVLASENPKYEPREYPLRIIRAFYTVKGCLNRERM